MNAPRAIVVFVPVPAAGSQEPLKRMKPIYPAKRSDQRWPLNQAIPRYTPDPAQIAALKRQGREVLEQVRVQRVAHG